jgi:GH15 family glucan-1,4-alpha-glucosidase
MANRYAPIEDYGIIGDLHTSRWWEERVDRLPLPPVFDSPSVFAALLDADRGGRFQIAPQLDDARTQQLYLPDTNVLLTGSLSEGGVAEVSDFMPVEDAGVAHNLVRRAKTVRGEVRFACAAIRASTTPAPRTQSSGAATRKSYSSAALARANSC